MNQPHLAAPSLFQMSDLVLRISVVLLVGILVGRALRSAPGEARHQVWLATLAGIVVAGALPGVTASLGRRFHGAIIVSPVAQAMSRPTAGSIAAALFLVWILGVLILSARFCHGILMARRIAGRARDVTRPA